MLLDEAKWLRRQFNRLSAGQLIPLCDLGSSTAEFRESVQDYIDVEIFLPLRARGISIVHVDQKDAPGVSVVGDVTNPEFLLSLGKFSAVMCCNLLEHVSDDAREGFAASLIGMLHSRGFLVVTVPNIYPHHDDPIDTDFRPSVSELVNLFSNMRTVAGEIIQCGEHRVTCAIFQNE